MTNIHIFQEGNLKEDQLQVKRLKVCFRLCRKNLRIESET